MAADDTNPGVAAATPKPKLLQLVRDAVRRKHYSPRTEDSYVHFDPIYYPMSVRLAQCSPTATGRVGLFRPTV